MLKVYVFVFLVHNAHCFIFAEDENEDHIRHRRSLPTPDEAQVCVDIHNRLRASIGEDIDEPTPANMQFMTWDQGLAYQALTYAKKCFWEHSPLGDRKTADWSDFNGENLWAGATITLDTFDPERGMNIWFNEYKDYEFYNMTCVPGKKCGHYTQMAWATSHKLGCAWTFCPILKFPKPQPDETQGSTFMVCMYAPGGNRMGKHLYEVGPRCSKCDPLDTCPNGTLCHNETRDAILPFRGKSGQTAGVLVGVMILVAAISSLGVYIYFYHQAKALKLIGLIRKSRRVSSAVNIVESDEPTSPKEEVNNDNGQKSSTIKDKKVKEETKTKSSKLASVQVEPVALHD